MKVDLDLARKAQRLGLSGHQLGEKLGVSTEEAIAIASVGRALVRVEGSILTEAEILVMTTIAEVTRELLQAGDTRSPESRQVSRRAGKASSWCAAAVRKRLFVSHYNTLSRQHERGLGFVELPGNGSVWLTPAGWALVHAVEAKR